MNDQFPLRKKIRFDFLRFPNITPKIVTQQSKSILKLRNIFHSLVTSLISKFEIGGEKSFLAVLPGVSCGVTFVGLTRT